jgi:hypothetical protein
MVPLMALPAGNLALSERCMEGLEAVASGLEQIAHHPAGKTALRENDAIKCKLCSQSIAGMTRPVSDVVAWL